MAYKVIYDTNFKVLELDRFPQEKFFLLLGVLFLLIFTTYLLILSTRKRVSKLEGEFSLIKSAVKKLTFEVTKLSSLNRKESFARVSSSPSSTSPLELSESELENLASLIVSKAPVKINRERLKELIKKNDVKSLARTLKMSTSEVEILLNLKRRGT
jgi:hypothetical protein